VQPGSSSGRRQLKPHASNASTVGNLSVKTAREVAEDSDEDDAGDGAEEDNMGSGDNRESDEIGDDRKDGDDDSSGFDTVGGKKSNVGVSARKGGFNGGKFDVDVTDPTNYTNTKDKNPQTFFETLESCLGISKNFDRSSERETNRKAFAQEEHLLQHSSNGEPPRLKRRISESGTRFSHGIVKVRRRIILSNYFRVGDKIPAWYTERR
jgi:hypothetical protein